MSWHKISVNELDTCTFTQNLAGSYGRGSHMSLDVIVTITPEGDCSAKFRVSEQQGIVGEFSTLKDAVEAYNELR